MNQSHYQLLDFGNGRKLESFGGRVLNRPSPAAEDVMPMNQREWQHADSVFDQQSKSWRHKSPWPDELLIDCGAFKMPVAPTPFGHVGLFPEQSENWRWLNKTELESGSGRETLALNLFAYTGASTMALASAGFSVAHVDAAKPNVQSARAAAELNGLSESPIRYLVDDAAKFAAREVRRKRQYHTIVLDPPAYGHGPSGKTWRVERDLWPLLENCLRLLDHDGFRILITGHSPQVGTREVTEFLRKTRLLPKQVVDGLQIGSGRSQLKAETGRRLDAGFFVRVSYSPKS